MTNIIDFPTIEDESITDPEYLHNAGFTAEIFVDFLIAHELKTAGDLEDFSQAVHLLMAEPNVPLCVIN